jgi:CDGSH iron-sulfur domain-containing protein 3
VLYIHKIGGYAYSAEIFMEQSGITMRETVAIDVKNGKDYLCCTCGKSKTQPFCDGPHNNNECNPFKYRATVDTTESFCASNKICDQSCPMMNTANPDVTNQT